MSNDKMQVCYGQGIAPYCPVCGSAEYLHNEDGNKNDFCGQCGCPLDWEQMKNEDTEQVEEKHHCGECVRFWRYPATGAKGSCMRLGKDIYQSRPACAKFKPSVRDFGAITKGGGFDP